MRTWISSIVFEIVAGAFVYRGWDIRGDHIHRQETPQSIRFGETGISLRLVDGRPKLDVPNGQTAVLFHSDHAFNGGKLVEGEFVEVKIY